MKMNCFLQLFVIEYRSNNHQVTGKALSQRETSFNPLATVNKPEQIRSRLLKISDSDSGTTDSDSDSTSLNKTD